MTSHSRGAALGAYGLVGASAEPPAPRLQVTELGTGRERGSIRPEKLHPDRRQANPWPPAPATFFLTRCPAGSAVRGRRDTARLTAAPCRGPA